ncbi:MAG TPA: RDD family protein [Chitinophagaceae bacterium]|nr:RDD family protein [Chitinophagaceae bacterium]
MGLITIGTPFNIDIEFSTAPMLRRITAVFLDMFILVLYMLLVYRFVIIGFDMGRNVNEFVMMTGISIIPFLYFPIMELLLNGQTPGKRLTGIKVMDREGNEPGMSQYLLRWLLGFGNYAVFLLPYIIATSASTFLLMLFFCIFAIIIFYIPDFLCALFTRHNQRIADLAAGTLVIDLKKKMDFSETIYLDISGQEQGALYPQVLQLSDRDINGIRNLIAKNPKSKTELAYRARIVHRIREALKVTEAQEDDKTFLEQLLRDYNYLTQRK